MSDKQGRAGVVTLAFPSRYLLAAPHEFLDQSDGFFLSVVTNRAGQGQGGQGRHLPTGLAGYI
jgi:hypothetical protein